MEAWVKQELTGLNAGDRRRHKRAEVILERMAARPEGSLPQAAADAAEVAAIYRLMNNPALGLDELAAAHRGATVERASGMRTVLCPQDTTFLNYSSQPTIEGLGGYSHQEHGLMVHLTLAASVDGLVLGCLDVQTLLHRQGPPVGRTYKAKAIADKQSARWLRSLEGLNELARTDESVGQWVSVADREADIYELFAADRHPRVHWLVRASHDRATTSAQSYLWDQIEAGVLLGEQTLQVHARAERPARQAVLEVRAQAVNLRPPRRRGGKLPGVEVWAVLARERRPPKGCPPVEWMLLSDLPMQNFEQAVEKLQWYARRWLIERFFYVLKSGCRVEALQLANRPRLETALGFYLIVAWRILWMTLWARTDPSLPATVALTDEEWKITWVMVRKRPPPLSIPTLADVIGWLAQMGGHSGKAHAKPPGPKAIWSGLQQVQTIRAYQLALKNV